MQFHKENDSVNPDKEPQSLNMIQKIALFFMRLFSFFRKSSTDQSFDFIDKSETNYQQSNQGSVDDEKFISDRSNKKNYKVKKAIMPINTVHRGLDKETGGLEIDYKKVQQEIEQDVDVWDDRASQIAKMGDDAEIDDAHALKSFIHRVKTGRYRKRSMGQVDLGTENLDDATHAKKVGEKRRNENNHGDKSR